MKKVNFGGNPVTLVGNELKVGDQAVDFTALNQDFTPFEFYKATEGKIVVISSVPSLDTGICEFQTTHFNQTATELSDEVFIVTISVDLPFAQKRFCGAHGIENIAVVSDHRALDFGQKYGFVLEEVRLLNRGIVVIDKNKKITYLENLDEVGKHVDYDGALEAVKSLL